MKSDKGFDESEKLLNQLEAQIHKEYAQATKEMTEKAEKYFVKFAKEDEAQRALYEDGKITKKEYTEWRQRKMLRGKQFTDMRDTLAKDLTNTDKIAMSYVRDKAIDTYALNMNYETYNIENDLKVDTSFSLYNHDSVKRLIKDNPDLLPQPSPDAKIDMKWNLQHLQSAITQGILQGESIPKIAARMQRVAAMDDRAAIRNARTAMTGAQNGGRLDAMERANERGVEVKKGWMATLDDRTRDSHVELDGEEREIDEEFSNGVMFPGDPEGEPAEVYNCRCRMIHVYPKHPVDWSDTSLRNTDKLGDMTYEEWKDRHKEKEEEPIRKMELSEDYKKYVDNNINKYYNIEHKECELLSEKLSESEMIERIAGGDLTGGSCASLSYAYIANKYCGLDVIDYRGGDSRKLFSANSLQIAKLLNKDVQIEFVSKEARDVAKVIKNIEANKEYRLVTGRHAAMIRKTEEGLEYLELQASKNNGWKPFEYTREYTFMGKEYKEKHTIADTLYERFGCRKTTMGHYFLEDAEKFKGNADFENLMGYINTSPDKQKKGASGHER